jgi:hypothetical protein
MLDASDVLLQGYSNGGNGYLYFPLVSPKMVQVLARHSDIRLTLGICAHVELQDQKAAIGAMLGPPSSGALSLKDGKEFLTA